MILGVKIGDVGVVSIRLDLASNRDTRPLFQRSSQAKDMAQIDTKLAMVKASILEHKKQLLQLPELNLPAATNLEKTQDPTSEEEDDELVGGEHKSLQISV
jgi:hypothetical protein